MMNMGTMNKYLEIHKHLNLQRCIKALFLDADSKKLSEDFLARRYDISEDYLVRLLRHECDAYTLDQVRGVAKMYKSRWVWPGATSENVKYSSTPTIFNMLLHFVDSGLIHMEGNTPVCHWEGLLRWHDLTTQVGEDLMVCAYLASHDIIAPQLSPRHSFNWEPCLSTDDVSLNMLLEMPLADIHSHLKGSSLNFDINWICLMNIIQGREKVFDFLKERVQSGHVSEKRGDTDLYKKAVLAATIRLHLVEMLLNHSSSLADILVKYISNNRELDIKAEANKLQSIIDNSRIRYGKQYQSIKDGDTAVIDYAIVNGLCVEELDSFTLLSGERYLHYAILKNIYNGVYEGHKIGYLFYLYLVIKNEIRHEITQLNGTVGFDNFSIYEDRKLIFVKGHEQYEKAAIHLAIKGFFGNKGLNNRYHEVRITPECTGEEIIKSIKNHDYAIDSDLFEPNNNHWDYKYIFHFIKQADDEDDVVSIKCRHSHLRDIVKQQSLAIYKYRHCLDKRDDGTYWADRAVGIDAANSEIACRPEVFAQAFRFLRHHSFENVVQYRPQDLGITFHVGEDFMDVVDGLRAVSEAILFLQLRKGDRIGHGLVLGVDVEEYYKSRNYTIAMSLQMMMDNLAWLYYHIKELKGFSHLLGGIKEKFEECYHLVYGGKKVPSIHVYYKSMLLRGDSPECYKLDGSVNNMGDDLDEWKSKSLNSNRLCCRARELLEARQLYYQYHYDSSGKHNGAIYNEWVVNKGIIEAIAIIQKQILEEVEEIGLAIECNPTSNLRIGEFGRYDEHPILKFNNEGLGIHPKAALSVSINTDDKGVFATSIEREYALIAQAIIRHFRIKGLEVSNAEVYDWLDRIRVNSLSQRFNKTNTSLDTPRKETIAKYRERIIFEEKERLSRLPWWKRVKRVMEIDKER